MGEVLTAESYEGERVTWILDRMSRLNKKEEITNVRTLANINNTIVKNDSSLSILSPCFLSPFPFYNPQATDEEVHQSPVSSLFARF